MVENWKKLRNIKVTVIPIVTGALDTVTVQKLDDLEIRGRVETIQSILEIGQNTKKSPGYLRRLLVTQIPVKNSQKSKIITLMTCKLDYRVSKNVQNIRRIHTLYYENYKKNLKVELAVGGRILTEMKIQSHIPERLAFTAAMCYSNDATQLFTKKEHRGLQIYKIIRKD